MYNTLHNPFLLVLPSVPSHPFPMRIILLLALASGAGWGNDAFGRWKMNPRRSTFAADPVASSFTLRIERHSSGEVFTVDRTEQDARSTTDSTVLFLDGAPRDYQDPECRGTQSSQRVDNRTVEILRTCQAGGLDPRDTANDHRQRTGPGGQRPATRRTPGPNAAGTRETVRAVHGRRNENQIHSAGVGGSFQLCANRHIPGNGQGHTLTVI